MLSHDPAPPGLRGDMEIPMTTTMNRTLRYGKGYTGRLGHKCWIARITGTDAKFGLRREFLAPDTVEREHFNRPRTMIDFTFALEVNGLYEMSAEGDRWFAMCYRTAAGELKTARVSDERVQSWARALDDGQTGNEARLASKGL